VKLLRVGPPAEEIPVALDLDGNVYDLTGLTRDITGEFLANGAHAVPAAIARGDLPRVDIALNDPTTRIGPPIARPGKVVCIGLNYRDHAAETGSRIPREPIIFFKDPGTVIGPNDRVLVPRKSVKTDWEVELAVVIGKRARYLDSDAQALECVAGYAVANDVSEREFQLERGGQWDKGKSCETFNPLGPWLVTPDEIADPQRLGLRLWVNGQQRQNGDTGNMIFGVAEIIRYISQFMVLEPGDLVNTGTPAGVAHGQPDPKPFLRDGDVMELEVDGLGRQRQEVGQA
jgi:2-keto-4-pentenoate hydratase/2-oxohepta-3-ene-1,7-dioic acid hydratase in catechol pathway